MDCFDQPGGLPSVSADCFIYLCVNTLDKANELKPRARQNVILELGYFLGALGRDRVCVLHKDKVELPSDIHGVLYVPMDSSNGWKFELTREMKQAGLPINLNKLA